MSFLIWLLLTSGFATFVGSMAYSEGKDVQEQEDADEAVESGHAEYFLDENNEKQWRWKQI